MDDKVSLMNLLEKGLFGLQGRFSKSDYRILIKDLYILQEKEAELDRREAGVALIPYTYTEANGFYNECGHCHCSGMRSYNTYCHKCGTKLIWPEEVK